MRPTNVLRAIQESLALLDRKLDDAGASVTFDTPDPGMNAIAGEVSLQQAMAKLISNALDAMSDGSERHLQITARDDGDALLIGTADTGPGIPAESLPSVFDPFFTTKDVGARLGLGLSVTYGIIQQFGGTISAHNREGGGASFQIRLQRARADAENAA